MDAIKFIVAWMAFIYVWLRSGLCIFIIFTLLLILLLTIVSNDQMITINHFILTPCSVVSLEVLLCGPAVRLNGHAASKKQI